MLSGEILNITERLTEPAQNSLAIYAKLHWATSRKGDRGGFVVLLTRGKFFCLLVGLLVPCFLCAISISSHLLFWKSYKVVKE